MTPFHSIKLYITTMNTTMTHLLKEIPHLIEMFKRRRVKDYIQSKVNRLKVILYLKHHKLLM